MLPLFLFSALGFLVMGYHPGAEDDAVYLTAIKADLHPQLFPHDAAFFQLQMRTSLFDTWMAGFVGQTGMAVAWAELLWQSVSILLLLAACLSIVRHLFKEPRAQWAGVAMVAAMFTLPVTGTGLYIMDQHLHPRNPATALVLLAVSRILARKQWQAVPLAALAFVLHPMMSALGISFCLALTLASLEQLPVHLRSLRERLIPNAATPLAAFIPFGWVFSPPSQVWLTALRSRHWFSVYNWEWYEWLGAVAPVVLFWVVAKVARRQGQDNLARFATAVFFYGVFQQAVAMVIQGPEALIGLATFEPMRFLHLVYIFMALVGGAYLGRHILGKRLWRWVVFLLIFNGGMFYAQRQVFAGTPHIELPSVPSSNPWLQAFEWIRCNTPEDAYFALDPHYMAAAGEDYHSFRALAERSQLADDIKDTSVVTKVPELAPVWQQQVEAEEGWRTFELRDFERLKAQFGVDWVLVQFPPAAGLACPWHNRILSVCRIPR